MSRWGSSPSTVQGRNRWRQEEPQISAAPPRTEDLQRQSNPPPLPTFQSGQDWKTSGLNLLKNAGQGVQNFFRDVTGQGAGEDQSAWQTQLKQKAGEAISFFPSTVTAALGVPAAMSSPGAAEAYRTNRKTLGGDEPGIFDFPAVTRGLNAARETRADELRNIAETETENPLARANAALGQGLYGALPNVLPASILPKGVIRGAAGAVGGVAKPLASGVSELTSRRSTRWMTDEGGSAQLPDRYTKAQRAEIERLSRGIQPELPPEAGGVAPAGPPRLAHHLDPAKVGPEVATRNQKVHDLNLELPGVVQRMQQGDTAAEPQVRQIILQLKEMGVPEGATIAKLKQAGIKGLPGTGQAITRVPPKPAAAMAEAAPSRAANEALAVERGVDPAAAIRGATEPSSTAAALRQKLTGAKQGPIVIPQKKGLGDVIAARANNLKGEPIQAGLSDAQKTAARAAAKARLQFDTGRSPDLTPAQIAEARAPIDLLTDPNVSAEELLAQRSRLRMEGTPVGNPAGTAAQAPVVAPPAPVAPAVGQGFSRTERLARAGKTRPAPAPRPAVTSGNAVTTKAPPPPPTTGINSLKVGAVIPGKGKVVQKASATAGPAIRRPAPVATPPVTPPVTPPSPQVPPSAATTATVTPPSPTRVTPPSQPLTASVRAPAGSVGGTPATGSPKVKGSTRAPVTLNPTTFMYEARTPGGLLIGQGTTKAAAIKAAQQYHAAQGSAGGAGGAPPPAPPVGGNFGKGGPPGAATPTGKAAGFQNVISEILNAPRLFQTIGDFSHLLRQNWVIGGGHPIELGKNAARAARALVDHGYARKFMESIENDVDTPKLQKLGLDLTTWERGKSLPGEEGYMSRLAQLPIAKHSNIAAVVLSNGMRYSVGKQILRGAKGASDDQLRAAMEFVNSASGRGNLPKFLSQGNVELLNGMFYSPKLQWSRVEIAAALPKAAITRNKTLFKEAARDIMGAYIAGTAFTQLAKLAGAKVEEDTTHPDWGRIQIGNSRVDIWSGFQPYARLLNQTFEGKRTTQSGKVIPLDRMGSPIEGQSGASDFSKLMDKYRPDAPMKKFLTENIYGRFIRSKLSPVTSIIVDSMLGEDFAGRPFDAKREVLESLTPISWQGIYEAIAEDINTGGSGLKGAGVGAMELLGAGVYTIPEGGREYPQLPEAIMGATQGLSLFKSNPSSFPGANQATETPKPKKTISPLNRWK